MSVLKNQRKLSPLQYEHSFKILYNDMRKRLNNIPKRRQEYLCRPIMKELNIAYDCVLSISSDYSRGKEKSLNKYCLIKNAIIHILSIQSPLYTLWNISYDSKDNEINKVYEAQRKDWCDQINKVINLLHGLLKSNKHYNAITDEEVKYIMYYTNAEINKAKFLKSMSRLHKFSHSKVIHLNRNFRNQEAELIISYVNDAWYHCIAGNKIIPENHKQYINRQNHFSKAISDLYKLNRPLLSIFNLCDFSEKEMREWSDLLNNTLIFLQKLQSSDRKRFSKL